MADPNYKVDLDIYSGPLDLLLYLIKQEEVDIYDIPIAHVTEQYLVYVEALRYIDLSLAGDFLVMASRLMEIKAKMLAPDANIEEEGEEEDPRLELVRQLIEYKRFKEAARDLENLAADHALRFGRHAEKHEEDDKKEDEQQALGEASLWDLLNAFSRLMRETGAETERIIVYDDVSVEEYMRRLFEVISQKRAMSFFDLFPDRSSRLVIIGTFLALLELIRLRKIRAEQAAPFGEIRIVLREEEPGAPAEAVSSEAEPAPEAHSEETTAEAPAEVGGPIDSAPQPEEPGPEPETEEAAQPQAAADVPVCVDSATPPPEQPAPPETAAAAAPQVEVAPAKRDEPEPPAPESPSPPEQHAPAETAAEKEEEQPPEQPAPVETAAEKAEEQPSEPGGPPADQPITPETSAERTDDQAPGPDAATAPPQPKAEPTPPVASTPEPQPDAQPDAAPEAERPSEPRKE